MSTSDYHIPNDDDVSPEDIHSDADLSNADLSEATLQGANLSHANLRRAKLDKADLTGANLSKSDLTGASILYATLRRAELVGATMENTRIGYHQDPIRNGFEPTDMSSTILNRADLSEAEITGADFSNSTLKRVDLSDAAIKEAEFTSANLKHATLSDATVSNSTFTRATLVGADLDGVRVSMGLPDSSHDNRFEKANLSGVDLSGAVLERCDFTDAKLSGVTLQGGSIEQSNLTRADLSGANLADCATHGATFTDAHIDDSTTLGTDPPEDAETPRWQIWKPNQSTRCVYDPLAASEVDIADVDMMKAADTYRSYEQLAGQNSRPQLQSTMFTLRQDMQRIQLRRDNTYHKWFFYRLNQIVFKYGESVWRTIGTGVYSIVAFALLYWEFGLIEDTGGSVITSIADTLYFSTMTFTTLGMGDFHPVPTSEFARGLVTLQAGFGAILIAIFVYVLGRRSTR